MSFFCGKIYNFDTHIATVEFVVHLNPVYICVAGSTDIAITHAKKAKRNALVLKY